jgi:flagellar biosynthetic protein FliR
MTGIASAAALVLLIIRPGVLIMGTPFLGSVVAPPTVRIGLSVLLAVVLAPFVTVPTDLSMAGLLIVVLREVAIGLSLAMAIQIIMAAADFAGNFSGYQIGLSMGALIDPQTGVRNNVLASLYSNLAIVICLISNAHLLLLRALADSYRALPIGVGGFDPGLASNVSRMLGLVFVLGVRIAAPVIVVLLLVELSLGLLARVAPSLNVMTAGAPIRLIAGLLVVAASVTALPAVITRYVPTALDLAASTARMFR